jgi:hypothetical protein
LLALLFQVQGEATRAFREEAFERQPTPQAQKAFRWQVDAQRETPNGPVQGFEFLIPLQYSPPEATILNANFVLDEAAIGIDVIDNPHSHPMLGIKFQ